MLENHQCPLDEVIFPFDVTSNSLNCNEPELMKYTHQSEALQSWENTMWCVGVPSCSRPVGKYHANTYCKLPFTTCVWLHRRLKFFNISLGIKKEEKQKAKCGGMLFQSVYTSKKKKKKPSTVQSRGIPSLRLGSLSDHSSREDGCQESLWAQLANKRPDLLLDAGPALVDSPTNAAGAPFNLLPSSFQTLSLTSPVNSMLRPSWGLWHLFCMYLQCVALQ